MVWYDDSAELLPADGAEDGGEGRTVMMILKILLWFSGCKE